MARSPAYQPYEPLLVPKKWGPNIWTVDGPDIGYSLAGLSVPCPSRMTVIKLADASLWVHSPVEWSPSLANALQKLGPVRHLIAPNINHYVHLNDWAERYPDAKVYALEALAEKIDLCDWIDVRRCGSNAWHGDISSVYFDVGSFEECVFVHDESRTVIFTDLMQRFETNRITNPFIRRLLSLGGATGPGGQPSIDMRLALRRHRKALLRGLAALETLAPERIILAHGRCFEKGALDEMKRAFAFL